MSSLFGQTPRSVAGRAEQAFTPVRPRSATFAGLRWDNEAAEGNDITSKAG